MGVWQGEDMDSLKYDKGLPCQTLYALRAGTQAEIALRLFQGWPARRVGGLQPSSTP